MKIKYLYFRDKLASHKKLQKSYLNKLKVGFDYYTVMCSRTVKCRWFSQVNEFEILPQ